MRFHEEWWWGTKVTLILDGIGFVQISIENDDPTVATIHDLHVEESHRRLGYGDKLLSMAEEEISCMVGIESITLSCEPNTFITDWYIRKGYKVVYQDLFMIELSRNI